MIPDASSLDLAMVAISIDSILAEPGMPAARDRSLERALLPGPIAREQNIGGNQRARSVESTPRTL